jgi:hypothetical protein
MMEERVVGGALTKALALGVVHMVERAIVVADPPGLGLLPTPRFSIMFTALAARVRAQGSPRRVKTHVLCTLKGVELLGACTLGLHVRILSTWSLKLTLRVCTVVLGSWL